LAKLGTNAVTAVPDLGGLLSNDSSAFVRATAADTLGAIGSGAAIVPLLARALQDADDSVRLHAALALGRFDEVAVLERDMNTYMSLRWNGRFDGSTVASRGGIDPAAISAIPALREALEDPNPNVRAAARFALEQIEAAGAEKNQP
jgi:HEAT repeat protein